MASVCLTQALSRTEILMVGSFILDCSKCFFSQNLMRPPKWRAQKVGYSEWLPTCKEGLVFVCAQVHQITDLEKSFKGFDGSFDAICGAHYKGESEDPSHNCTLKRGNQNWNTIASEETKCTSLARFAYLPRETNTQSTNKRDQDPKQTITTVGTRHWEIHWHAMPNENRQI